jgi:RNA polymerase sigma-70 factor (ECF subfamily)
MSSFDERELLSRLAGDDMSAFDTLYNFFEPRLRLVLYPYFGSDADQLGAVLQDVFVKLWLKRKELKDIVSLEYYLQRAARNKLLDILKTNQTRLRHELGYGRLQPLADDTTEHHLKLKEYMDIAREGLSLLPERRRAIFTMYAFDGLTLDEVASQMNISKEVVKKQLQLAKVFLKQYLSREGGMPLTVGGLLLASVMI